MTRLFLLIPLLIALYFALRWFARAKVNDAKRAITMAIFCILLALLVFLAITGKLNWLFAAAVAAYPVIRKIWGGWRIFRWLKGVKKSQQESAGGTPVKPNRSGMTFEAAYAVLKLKPGASREQIITAHRKLMSQAHPDRGGSDQQAQQLNAAKEFLIKQLDEKSA